MANFNAAANTKRFMLGEATVCLLSWTKYRSVYFGATTPTLTDIKNLPFPNMTPESYSIGMAKNVALSGAFNTKELRHGVEQRLVYDVPGPPNVTITGELFEMSSKTLAYLMSIQSPENFAPVAKTSAAASDNWFYGYTVTAVATGGTAANDYTAKTLQELPGTSSDVYIIQDAVYKDKIARAVGGTDISVIKGPDNTTVLFPVNAVVNVFKIHTMEAFNKRPEWYAMRLIGTAIEDDIPTVIDLPRVTMVTDLKIPFGVENFNSMSFNFKSESLRPEDPMFGTFPYNTTFQISTPQAQT